MYKHSLTNHWLRLLKCFCAGLLYIASFGCEDEENNIDSGYLDMIDLEIRAWLTRGGFMRYSLENLHTPILNDPKTLASYLESGDKHKILLACAKIALYSIRDPRVLNVLRFAQTKEKDKEKPTPPPELVGLLVPKLQDPDEEVRIAAALALRAYDSLPRELTKKLLPLIDDKSPFVRLAAITSLNKLDISYVERTIPIALAILKEGNIYEQHVAMGVLALSGPPAAPALIRVLTDGDASIRWGAALALGYMRPPVQEAIPFLTRLLYDDEQEYVRRAAGLSLGKMGKTNEDVLDTFIQIYKSNNRGDKELAELLIITSFRDSSLPMLQRYLQKHPQDEAVKSIIARTLHFASNTDVKTNIIFQLFNDRSASMRQAALEAYKAGSEKSGKADSSELFQLLNMAKEQQDNGSIAIILSMIVECAAVTPAVLEELVALSSDKSADVRRSVIAAIGRLNMNEKTASTIVRALNDRNPDVRLVAASVLNQHTDYFTTKDNTGAISTLERALQILESVPEKERPRDGLLHAIAYLKKIKRAEFLGRALDLLDGHPMITLAASFVSVYIAVILIVRFIILKYWPLKLFGFCEAVHSHQIDASFETSNWIGKFKVQLDRLFLLEYFHYHPYVLDGWLDKHLGQAYDKFRELRAL